nr:hypothetical protein [Bacteroides thetaiotaomicron]
MYRYGMPYRKRFNSFILFSPFPLASTSETIPCRSSTVSDLPGIPGSFSTKRSNPLQSRPTNTDVFSVSGSGE